MEIDFVEYDRIKEDLCIKVIEHIYQKVQDNKYSFTELSSERYIIFSVVYE